MFIAVMNTPGYLPEDDDPPVFDTTGEAWSYLAERRREGEDHVETDIDTGEYSETVAELDRLAEEGAECGSLIGDTPDGGIYDIGIVYCVMEEDPEAATDRMRSYLAAAMVPGHIGVPFEVAALSELSDTQVKSAYDALMDWENDMMSSDVRAEKALWIVKRAHRSVV